MSTVWVLLNFGESFGHGFWEPISIWERKELAEAELSKLIDENYIGNQSCIKEFALNKNTDGPASERVEDLPDWLD